MRKRTIKKIMRNSNYGVVSCGRGIPAHPWHKDYYISDGDITFVSIHKTNGNYRIVENKMTYTSNNTRIFFVIEKLVNDIWVGIKHNMSFLIDVYYKGGIDKEFDKYKKEIREYKLNELLK